MAFEVEEYPNESEHLEIKSEFRMDFAMKSADAFVDFGESGGELFVADGERVGERSEGVGDGIGKEVVNDVAREGSPTRVHTVITTFAIFLFAVGEREDFHFPHDRC
jgi:hypothetical protein